MYCCDQLGSGHARPAALEAVRRVCDKYQAGRTLVARAVACVEAWYAAGEHMHDAT